MKSKAAGVITGIVIIVFGMILYPYFNTYLVTPLNDWLINSFFPSFMDTIPTWLSLVLAVSPFLVFILIIFAGVMYIRNKLKGDKQDYE